MKKALCFSKGRSDANREERTGKELVRSRKRPTRRRKRREVESRIAAALKHRRVEGGNLYAGKEEKNTRRRKAWAWLGAGATPVSERSGRGKCSGQSSG